MLDRDKWETHYAIPDRYGYEHRWLQERKRRENMGRLLAEFGPFDRALDLGSGEGFLTAVLAPHCRSLVSLEISSAAIRRQRVRLAGDRRLFLQGDAFASAFTDRAFDLVVASEVLGYARERRLEHADAWRRWIRPGGLLILVETLLPTFFDYDELMRLVTSLVTLVKIEPVTSKHPLAKLANHRLVPSACYEQAMRWTRARPEHWAKHLCVIGRVPA